VRNSADDPNTAHGVLHDSFLSDPGSWRGIQG
jgi:hypothetical protein